jgi:alpha-L-fucosidase 2
VGDFLVSSSIRNGKVVEVRITSQRGGTCNLANPWGSGFAAKLQIAGGASSVLRGTVLTIATRPGERLVFTPSPN